MQHMILSRCLGNNEDSIYEISVVYIEGIKVGYTFWLYQVYGF